MCVMCEVHEKGYNNLLDKYGETYGQMIQFEMELKSMKFRIEGMYKKAVDTFIKIYQKEGWTFDIGEYYSHALSLGSALGMEIEDIQKDCGMEPEPEKSKVIYINDKQEETKNEIA